MDGTQKAVSWVGINLPDGRNDERRPSTATASKRERADGDLKGSRTIEETRELLDLVQAISSPLITTEPRRAQKFQWVPSASDG